MNMVIPNEGKMKWLRWAVGTNGVDLEDYVLALYRNDITPVDTSSTGDFTTANFLGYLPVTILRSEMGTPVIVSNVAETTRSNPPTFTSVDPAAQTIYGWILLSSVFSTLMAAQRFDSPRLMTLGASLAIDPFKIKLKTFS